MLRIEALEIDDHILEKIEARHGISFTESLIRNAGIGPWNPAPQIATPR